MWSQSAAPTGSIGIWFTHPKTPGRPVLGHRTSEIGVFFEPLMGVDSLAVSGVS